MENREEQSSNRALGDADEYLRLAFDALPVAVIVAEGMEQRVLFMNRKFVELFGYTQEDISSVADWYPLAFPELHYRLNMQSIMEDFGRHALVGGPPPPPIEAHVHTKYGNDLYIEFRLSFLGGRSIVAFTDLTESKRVEESLIEKEKHSSSLLSLSQRLELAESYDAVLAAVSKEISRIAGIQSVWVYLFDEDRKHARFLSARGSVATQLPGEWAVLDVTGDRMMEEVAASKDIVIVTDARLDERTNKEIVAKLGSRTIINVPVWLFERKLGSIGMGTFGEEGVRTVTEREKEYLRALASHVAVALDRIHSIAERRRAQESLRRAMESAIQSLASALELRDQYTAGHQRRVAQLAAGIGRQLGLEEERIHGLYLAGVVHDIGKIYVPSEILTRPSRLTDVEFALVKTHVTAGYDILKSIDFPWPIAEIVREHHENVDGSGYPRGLKGEEILLEGRILAVADVVEAITNHRPYRPAMGLETALRQLRLDRGIRYDGRCVDACIAVFEAGFTFDR